MATSSIASPFGDSLLCPVCFIVFEGRIMQCNQGHAVCERCQLQLNECPHCRGMFAGTRNYILEDLIAKLRSLNSSNEFLGGDSERAAAAEKKKMENQPTTNEAPPNADLPAPALSAADLLQAAENLFALDDDDLINPQYTYDPPAQSKGLFACRMFGCINVSLPICRLLTHLRYHHQPLLVEHVTDLDNPNDDYLEQISFPGRQSYRRAIHIPNFGIFFLIVNLNKDNPDFKRFYAWVQSAIPNTKARSFRFSLELTLGNSIIRYKDFVYGNQSDAAYIQVKQQCLYFETTSNYRTANIEVRIGRNIGATDGRRHSNSVVRHIEEVPVFHSGVAIVVPNNTNDAQPDRATPPAAGGRHNRRTNNRRRR